MCSAESRYHKYNGMSDSETVRCEMARITEGVKNVTRILNSATTADMDMDVVRKELMHILQFFEDSRTFLTSAQEFALLKNVEQFVRITGSALGEEAHTRCVEFLCRHVNKVTQTPLCVSKLSLEARAALCPLNIYTARLHKDVRNLLHDAVKHGKDINDIKDNSSLYIALDYCTRCSDGSCVGWGKDGKIIGSESCVKVLDEADWCFQQNFLKDAGYGCAMMTDPSTSIYVHTLLSEYVPEELNVDVVVKFWAIFPQRDDVPKMFCQDDRAAILPAFLCGLKLDRPCVKTVAELTIAS